MTACSTCSCTTGVDGTQPLCRPCHLAAYSSKELLAHNLVNLEQARLRDLEDHTETVAVLKAQISYAGRVGARVLKAQLAGRKTVRIADLIEGEQS